MKKIYMVVAGVFFSCVTAHAVPVLQIGAPAGPGDSGVYADYIDPLSNPTEEDTAVTSGSTLYVAGVTEGLTSLGSYTAWGDFNKTDEDYTKFNGHGAVLIATFESESAALSSLLTVNGVNPFSSDATLSFPNNHDPLKDSFYMYFDIGNFATGGSDFEAIPDFADESIGSKYGEIKDILLAIDPGFVSWIHFDVLAVAIDTKHNGSIVNILENNPGSHDVTWKDGSDNAVPEPATMLLFGAGLAGLAGYRRRKNN